MPDQDSISSGATTSMPDGKLPGERGSNLALLMELALPVRVRFGKAVLRLDEALKLNCGVTIDVQQPADELVDIMVNDRVVARGQVLIVEDNYAVRIESIVSRGDRLGGPH